jgi:putative transposase
LKLLPTNGLKNGVWKVLLSFNTQLRLSTEEDRSRGVLVDLSEKTVKVRRWNGARGNTFILKVTDVSLHTVDMICGYCKRGGGDSVPAM